MVAVWGNTVNIFSIEVITLADYMARVCFVVSSSSSTTKHIFRLIFSFIEILHTPVEWPFLHI